MQLTDEDIVNFQALYRTEFGIEISKDDAYEKGSKLLGLMSAIYKPIPNKEDQAT
jgi:hypothetical protein